MVVLLNLGGEGGGGFCFCTESVREQSVFEVLCCCNIGCIYVGKALIITISLCDCSLMLPKLERGGAGLITH